MRTKRGRGHPDVFTPKQNAALRAALRGFRSERGFSQTALGLELGIGQQAIGRLLRGDGGFSYDPATHLVRALGFEGVDAFFAAKGVALGLQPTGT